MQASNTFKKAFLKLMIKGLKQDGLHSKSMSFHEKKRAIKISADAAMALARGRTQWSNALITNLSKQENTNNNNKVLDRDEKMNATKWKIPTSKKILRRSIRSQSRATNVPASVVARRMVKKRTQLLKRIIPGGESMDSLSLLGETLDYVIYLRAQVNLMQCLSKALGASNLKSHKSIHCTKVENQEKGGSRILQARESEVKKG